MMLSSRAWRSCPAINDFAVSERKYWSSASKKAFLSPENRLWCVCMPEPFSVMIGLGINVA
jgi:hypothetical protein